MVPKKAIAISVFCGSLLTAAAQTASPINGLWTIFGPPIDGKVQLTLESNGRSSHFHSSSSVPLDQLRGLTRAQFDAPAAAVRFEIARDAGTFHFEGSFKNGNGSGDFTFSPNAAFASEMQSMGYGSVPADNAFAMALHDVRLSFARDLRSLGIDPVSSDQLIAMRIHGVSIDYIRELQSLGYAGLSPDKLIAMRIHGVSAAFAREMKDLGYTASPDQMVALCIHGVDAPFVKQVQALGYAPTLDQLVALRIHGVTPEFIRNLQSRGMKNLTVDQMVSLRIHGID